MAFHNNRAAASQRKKLICFCAVLAAVLLTLLTLLIVYISYEKSTAKNVYLQLTAEAGSDAITPEMLLAEPDGKPVTITQNVTAEQMRTPGKYEILFTWRERTFRTILQVVDTVKPSGTAKDLTVMGPVPPAEDFVTDIQDVTEVTVSYKEAPDMTKEGTQPITLLLTDTSGNTTELTANANVVVDSQPPEITGLRNITVYIGDAVAYRSGVTVTDDHDEAPTLTVDNSGVDLSTVGKYTVTYTAKDLSGNETTRKVSVEVREKVAGAVDLDKLYAAADKVIGQIIKDDMTQKQQVQAIYKWARSSCSYSNHSDKSDYLKGAYEMLTKRAGDCFNYFAVTKLLFDRLGIANMDVRKVKNYTGDSDHFWSLVSLDEGKSWYHFDATPRVGNGDDFCLVTDAFLDAYSKKHDNCHNRDTSLYPATPER